MIYKHSFLSRVAIWTMAALFAPVVWLGEKILGADDLPEPNVYFDGDEWCAIVEHGPDCFVAGFGCTPERAVADFRGKWRLAQERDYFGQLPSV